LASVLENPDIKFAFVEMRVLDNSDISIVFKGKPEAAVSVLVYIGKPEAVLLKSVLVRR